jgi:hypothetical protein
MVRVDRIDEQLAALSKPSLEPLSSFRPSDDHCLVMCAGFEKRAIAFLTEVTRRQLHKGRVLIVNYVPVLPQNRLEETQRKCKGAGLSFETIDYDRENVAGFGDLICRKLGSDPGRIYVDVSGMSRLLIVQILVALQDRPRGFRGCSVLYAEASKYPPSEVKVMAEIKKMDIDPLHTAMLLSSGVFDVHVIPELASTSYDGQQSRLVAFPSFNIDQLIALRNELQPSHCTIIHGVPPDPQNKWRTDAISKLNHLENTGTGEVFYTSTLDYRETLDCLLRIYANHGTTERILVAPTGSKMQSVSVGLLRAFVRDIQIAYPAARDFTSPTNYTRGVKRLYHLPLDAFVLHKSP